MESHEQEMWELPGAEYDPLVMKYSSWRAAPQTVFNAALGLIRRDLRISLELRGQPFAALEIRWGQKPRQS